MNIPAELIRRVADGSVVLLLGAGASMGAKDASGSEPPLGSELAGLLSDKFLGGAHRDEGLAVVAELATSESDLATVQDYVASLFRDVQPAPFHSLLPTFKWAGLATTNFDLVVERAYQSASKSFQKVVPLIRNGDRIEEHLRRDRDIPLLKLHGCVTRSLGHQSVGAAELKGCDKREAGWRAGFGCDWAF